MRSTWFLMLTACGPGAISIQETDMNPRYTGDCMSPRELELTVNGRNGGIPRPFDFLEQVRAHAHVERDDLGGADVVIRVHAMINRWKLRKHGVDVADVIDLSNTTTGETGFYVLAWDTLDPADLGQVGPGALGIPGGVLLSDGGEYMTTWIKPPNDPGDPGQLSNYSQAIHYAPGLVGQVVLTQRVGGPGELLDNGHVGWRGTVAIIPSAPGWARYGTTEELYRRFGPIVIPVGVDHTSAYTPP